jgi:hypothetical protein
MAAGIGLRISDAQPMAPCGWWRGACRDGDELGGLAFGAGQRRKAPDRLKVDRAIRRIIIVGAVRPAAGFFFHHRDMRDTEGAVSPRNPAIGPWPPAGHFPLRHCEEAEGRRGNPPFPAAAWIAAARCASQ